MDSSNVMAQISVKTIDEIIAIFNESSIQVPRKFVNAVEMVLMKARNYALEKAKPKKSDEVKENVVE